MKVLTHRGLEPHNRNFGFIESSKEAFLNHLERGYGIEFDVNFAGDDFCFVFHDSDLSRITNGGDTRKFAQLNSGDICGYVLGSDNHFISFEELLYFIDLYRKPGEYSAIHLKSKFQTHKYVDVLIGVIEKYKKIEQKIFIFDVNLEIAEYIYSKNSQIKLFPSVAHEYDRERYNTCTGETLLSIEDVLENKHLFQGVWLDEWDRSDFGGKEKMFYTKENFDLLRRNGFLIGLVTPELHAKSPGLLGGELHQDCFDNNSLKKRFQQIIALKPDFICSDYLNFIE